MSEDIIVVHIAKSTTYTMVKLHSTLHMEVHDAYASILLKWKEFGVEMEINKPLFRIRKKKSTFYRTDTLGKIHFFFSKMRN